MKDQDHAKILWINFIIMFSGMMLSSAMYYNWEIIGFGAALTLFVLAALPAVFFLIILYVVGDNNYRRSLRIRVYFGIGSIVFCVLIRLWRML